MNIRTSPNTRNIRRIGYAAAVASLTAAVLLPTGAGAQTALGASTAFSAAAGVSLAPPAGGISELIIWNGSLLVARSLPATGGMSAFDPATGTTSDLNTTPALGLVKSSTLFGAKLTVLETPRDAAWRNPRRDRFHPWGGHEIVRNCPRRREHVHANRGTWSTCCPNPNPRLCRHCRYARDGWPG
jgi:hypothetical protein